ncbi:hypothetical protein CEF21_10810 [Bacillus sp. FJAT-42376]|uniref:DUF6944 family repetitive protein n=1 Tax=Bacillus sp. FJAT-42376 TaxID=2014076 RepID=UPI000F504466|nr:hypothetical protein [Bacillus sp. FJAT-42376]AZB42743.1 hypothetical protein CEF21_10810 [Bacillus sp. FJAT-42376]
MAGYEILLEITGAWIQSIGTAIAAAGETLVAGKESEYELGEKLVVIGNGVEATGNALQAIALSTLGTRPFSVLGSWLQAAGNSTNTVAGILLLRGEETAGLKLDILGDSIQSAGAAIEANFVDERLPFAEAIVIGEYLLSLGAALEAIGAAYLLQKKKEKGNALQAFGSYLEYAGATLVAASLTKGFIWYGNEEENQFVYPRLI